MYLIQGDKKIKININLFIWFNSFILQRKYRSDNFQRGQPGQSQKAYRSRQKLEVNDVINPVIYKN